MVAAAGEIVIIAGPNGAGKTTFARGYLPDDVVFVNADLIAAGLTATDFRGGSCLRSWTRIRGRDAVSRSKPRCRAGTMSGESNAGAHPAMW